MCDKAFNVVLLLISELILNLIEFMDKRTEQMWMQRCTEQT